MASLSLPQFHLPTRWSSKFVLSGSVCIVHIPHYKFSSSLNLSFSAKRKVMVSAAQDEAVEGVTSKKKTKGAKVSAARGRKKAVKVNEEEDSELGEESDKKPKRRTRKKATSASVGENDEKIEKKTRGRKSKKSILDKGEGQATDAELDITNIEAEKIEKKPRGRKKKVNTIDYQATDAELDIANIEEEDDTENETVKKPRGRTSKKKEEATSDLEASDNEGVSYQTDEDIEDELDIELGKTDDNDDDITSTYRWPPLVCCFGAAQHAFVPSGKPSNRLIDYKIHDRLKDALWEPEKFVRAPGGSAGSVAIALASLGGRVALMGKLGDDRYGQSMLYYLNVNNVQTRAVCVDSKRQTAVSKMKIAKRGGLRMISVKPCAEDSLTRAEVNIDLLKEAKMFYLTTSSLLDQNMRKTTLRALRIAKKLGSTIFFDLNLPLPLWKSSEEAKGIIQQVWNLADIIEVTIQELEFLCGITPSENFDTRDNDPSKFVHYEPDVIAPLWHEGIKVLFVTNGTSEIHYYTKDMDGSVLGMEDAPITPYTCDMSASGDGIVAAFMRMLIVQPHLMTDKDYLEHTVKYAINCGVTSQWILGRQRGFPLADGVEDDDIVPDEFGITSLTEREFRTVAPVEVS